MSFLAVILCKYKLDEGNRKLLDFKAFYVDDQSSPFMGSAQKISSDPVVFLVGWGSRMRTNGLFAEIDFTNQKKIFEVVYGKNASNGGAFDTYRAYKFDK